MLISTHCATVVIAPLWAKGQHRLQVLPEAFTS